MKNVIETYELDREKKKKKKKNTSFESYDLFDF
jgi:hypothetical protein